MAIEWRSVYSSNAAAIGYDGERHELFVRWANNGRISAYEGVPVEVFQQLSNAPSVGVMLNDVIKPNYRHRYV